MRIIHPSYRSHEAFIDSIPGILESQGALVKDGRNLIKVLTLPDGTPVNVKRFHAPRWLNMVVYSTGLRRAKGLRAYRHALLLAERGIATPAPVAYLEERRWGVLRLSYFVSVQCPYPHTFYELGDAPEGSYERLAEAFAAFTAHMHGQQVLHRDYSPGNILWEETADGGYRFSVVDINRLRLGPVDMQRGCANFARLWGPKRFVRLVVREYATLRGFDPDEAEQEAMAARKAFWTRFSRRHRVKFPLEL